MPRFYQFNLSEGVLVTPPDISQKEYIKMFFKYLALGS